MQRDTKQLGLFDYQNRLEDLASRPSALDRLNRVVDWEVFRPVLTRLVVPESSAPAGRPRFDVVMMFKVLVLQRTHALSDEQAEALVLDRFSFQRFLGLTVADDVPKRTTIWDYREALRKSGGEAELWKTFDRLLTKVGVKLTAGKIIDASFVDVPRQHNSKDDNAAINDAKMPKGWEEKSTSFVSQKDRDARWAKKHDEEHFGYKNHVKVDRKTKLIEEYAVSSANVGDQDAVEHLVKKGDGTLWADKGYGGKRVGDILAKGKIRDRRQVQARHCHPLTLRQMRSNQSKARIRARVEHVFGAMKHMRADYIRCIGIARATFVIALNNLVYNLHRLAWLKHGPA
jgi:transposase, IS5 family